MARKTPPPEPPLEQVRRPALLRNLIAFQARRLTTTYADLVRSERFRALAEFFFRDVYSTEDKSKRDEEFKRLYETFRRKLGDRITRGIGELVELNDLSHGLDLLLAEALWEITGGDSVDDEGYEEGYRRCDNYDVRVKQIEMLTRSVRYFLGLAQYRTIGLVLRAVKSAAALFGGGTVISFLDRGYRAYRSVTPEEGEFFVTTIRDRERARLDRICRRPGWEPCGRW